VPELVRVVQFQVSAACFDLRISFATFMQVNGDKSKLKRNTAPSPPSSAHSSGLQVPTDASTRSPFTNTFRSRYMTMISPRSSNYERLEGGMGPSRVSLVRFGWKKFGIVACVLIGLIYLFGPRQKRWTYQEKQPG
jgi:guanosine-diphosphatase